MRVEESIFFFSSRRRHTRYWRDWSSDVCSSDLSTIVESSSGSTAVSEAYFARMLGLPFVAVMPASTSPEKVALIEFHGGRCHFVERAPDIYEEARRLAAECGGHYLDPFSNAERAPRSEERRGGEEGRSRGAPDPLK